MIKLLMLLACMNSFSAENDLNAFSEKINKTLPEVYDRVTKLRTSSVQNNNLYYHFLVSATQAEYTEFVPKVKAQILKTVCGQAREKMILKGLKANLVYQYENEKGQSLGEFMVQPSHCL